MLVHHRIHFSRETTSRSSRVSLALLTLMNKEALLLPPGWHASPSDDTQHEVGFKSITGYPSSLSVTNGNNSIFIHEHSQKNFRSDQIEATVNNYVYVFLGHVIQTCLKAWQRRYAPLAQLKGYQANLFPCLCWLAGNELSTKYHSLDVWKRYQIKHSKTRSNLNKKEEK